MPFPYSRAGFHTRIDIKLLANNLYQGAVCFDGLEMKVPVVVGDGIPEILIGLPWLQDRRLVVDRKAGILTLE